MIDSTIFQEILLFFFSQKSCSDEEIMFSSNMPILSFLQSSNYSAQHAACFRNKNARVCVIHLLNCSARADQQSIFSQTWSFELPGGPKKTWSQSTSKLNVIHLCWSAEIFGFDLCPPAFCTLMENQILYWVPFMRTTRPRGGGLGRAR